jgi:hypothetical protein
MERLRSLVGSAACAVSRFVGNATRFSARRVVPAGDSGGTPQQPIPTRSNPPSGLTQIGLDPLKREAIHHPAQLRERLGEDAYAALSEEERNAWSPELPDFPS